MPLTMSKDVFITCAVTGSGGTQDRSPHVPRSPKQIAESAIEAARGAAEGRALRGVRVMTNPLFSGEQTSPNRDVAEEEIAMGRGGIQPHSSPRNREKLDSADYPMNKRSSSNKIRR